MNTSAKGYMAWGHSWNICLTVLIFRTSLLGGSSCFAGVMLVNLVACLAVSRSPSLGCWAAVVRGIFEAGSRFGVKTLS